jgi:hypothetical protein
MDFHRLGTPHGEIVVFGKRLGVANVGGGGAGASVSTSVQFTDKYQQPQLPQSLAYIVTVSPSQPCVATITNKSSSGFNVVLTPLNNATLSAGSFDLMVMG